MNSVIIGVSLLVGGAASDAYADANSANLPAPSQNQSELSSALLDAVQESKCEIVGPFTSIYCQSAAITDKLGWTETMYNMGMRECSDEYWFFCSLRNYVTAAIDEVVPEFTATITEALATVDPFENTHKVLTTIDETVFDPNGEHDWGKNSPLIVVLKNMRDVKYPQ